MQASTEHEREIVQAVNELATRGPLKPSSVADVGMLLSFAVTPDESKFLVRYVLWRIEQRELKPGNKREKAILKVVETRCQAPNCSYPSVLPEISGSVSFSMSRAEVDYLIDLVKRDCPPSQPEGGDSAAPVTGMDLAAQ